MITPFFIGYLCWMGGDDPVDCPMWIDEVVAGWNAASDTFFEPWFKRHMAGL